MAGSLRPLVLTLGDPAGIGPDISLSAWQRLRSDPELAFYLIGSASTVVERARALAPDVPIRQITEAEEALSIFPNALPVLDLGSHFGAAPPGRQDVRFADETILAIERAVDAVGAGRASAMITNPISKHVLRAAGFAHAGHTDFLAELTVSRGLAPAPAPHPVMMLATDTFRVVPLTVHIPLCDVVGQITTDLIETTCKIVARELVERFAIAQPRLVVAGLNPHAGEQGTIGREEQTTIAPAVNALRKAGLDIRGPFPADTLFHPAARATYDAAIAMYHDQALIPIKTIAFESAVNVTLGLPFVRTSPDHGTAYDIAGHGTASPESLIAAIRMGRTLSGNDRQVASP